MCARSTRSEVSAISMIGASAGFTLRYEGLLGRFAGSWPRAALIAACTSRPAASMFRFKSNCSTMLVEPSWLVEVIWLTPEMRPNWRSRGVATADAIVCGSAPGKLAPTPITGKSTLGNDATGRKLKARIPESSSAAASSDVPIGRRINGAEILIVNLPRHLLEQRRPGSDYRSCTFQIDAPTGQTTDKPQAWCRA